VRELILVRGMSFSTLKLQCDQLREAFFARLETISSLWKVAWQWPGAAGRVISESRKVNPLSNPNSFTEKSFSHLSSHSSILTPADCWPSPISKFIGRWLSMHLAACELHCNFSADKGRTLTSENEVHGWTVPWFDISLYE
jgi:hypothetical protein